MSDTGLGSALRDATTRISSLNFNTPKDVKNIPLKSDEDAGISSTSASGLSSSFVKPTYKNRYKRDVPIAKSDIVQRPSIPRSSRVNLKDKDAIGIMESFTKPLKTTLDILDYTKLNEISEEVFERNKKIETFLTNLMERLEYYEASDVLREQILLGPVTDRMMTLRGLIQIPDRDDL